MIDLQDKGLSISIVTGIWYNTSEVIIGYDPKANEWEIASYYDGDSETYIFTNEQLANNLDEALEANRISKDNYVSIIKEIKEIKKEFKN